MLSQSGDDREGNGGSVGQTAQGNLAATAASSAAASSASSAAASDAGAAASSAAASSGSGAATSKGTAAKSADQSASWIDKLDKELLSKLEALFEGAINRAIETERLEGVTEQLGNLILSRMPVARRKAGMDLGKICTLKMRPKEGCSEEELRLAVAAHIRLWGKNIAGPFVAKMDELIRDINKANDCDESVTDTSVTPVDSEKLYIDGTQEGRLFKCIRQLIELTKPDATRHQDIANLNREFQRICDLMVNGKGIIADVDDTKSVEERFNDLLQPFLASHNIATGTFAGALDYYEMEESTFKVVEYSCLDRVKKMAPNFMTITDTSTSDADFEQSKQQLLEMSCTGCGLDAINERFSEIIKQPDSAIFEAVRQGALRGNEVGFRRVKHAYEKIMRGLSEDIKAQKKEINRSIEELTALAKKISSSADKASDVPIEKERLESQAEGDRVDAFNALNKVLADDMPDSEAIVYGSDHAHHEDRACQASAGTSLDGKSGQTLEDSVNEKMAPTFSKLEQYINLIAKVSSERQRLADKKARIDECRLDLVEKGIEEMDTTPAASSAAVASTSSAAASSVAVAKAAEDTRPDFKNAVLQEFQKTLETVKMPALGGEAGSDDDAVMVALENTKVAGDLIAKFQGKKGAGGSAIDNQTAHELFGQHLVSMIVVLGTAFNDQRDRLRKLRDLGVSCEAAEIAEAIDTRSARFEFTLPEGASRKLVFIQQSDTGKKARFEGTLFGALRALLASLTLHDGAKEKDFESLNTAFSKCTRNSVEARVQGYVTVWRLNILAMCVGESETLIPIVKR